jgi:hypothetical protein
MRKYFALPAIPGGDFLILCHTSFFLLAPIYDLVYYNVIIPQIAVRVKNEQKVRNMEYNFNEMIKVRPDILDQLLADYLMRYYDMTDEQQKNEREKLSRLESEHGQV